MYIADCKYYYSKVSNPSIYESVNFYNFSQLFEFCFKRTKTILENTKSMGKNQEKQDLADHENKFFVRFYFVCNVFRSKWSIEVGFRCQIQPWHSF